MKTFMPDHRLVATNVLVCEWPLSQVWLVNDSRYPWIMLVPARESASEIFDLHELDQIQLGRESLYLARQMAEHFSAHKMNVAAIGNVVPQLHIHHVARFESDATWPGTVWGVGNAIPYSDGALRDLVVLLRGLLAWSSTLKQL